MNQEQAFHLLKEAINQPPSHLVKNNQDLSVQYLLSAVTDGLHGLVLALREDNIKRSDRCVTVLHADASQGIGAAVYLMEEFMHWTHGQGQREKFEHAPFNPLIDLRVTYGCDEAKIVNLSALSEDGEPITLLSRKYDHFRVLSDEELMLLSDTMLCALTGARCIDAPSSPSLNQSSERKPSYGSKHRLNLQ